MQPLGDRAGDTRAAFEWPPTGMLRRLIYKLRGIQNDGLTRRERRACLRGWREGPGRKLSDSEREAVYAWVKEHVPPTPVYRNADGRLQLSPTDEPDGDST